MGNRHFLSGARDSLFAETTKNNHPREKSSPRGLYGLGPLWISLAVFFLSGCVSADYGVAIKPLESPETPEDLQGFVVRRISRFSSGPEENGVAPHTLARSYWTSRILLDFGLTSALAEEEQVELSRSLFEFVPAMAQQEGLYQILEFPDFFQSGEPLIFQNQVYSMDYRGIVRRVVYLVSNAGVSSGGINRGRSVISGDAQYFLRLVITPQGGLVDLSDWLRAQGQSAEVGTAPTVENPQPEPQNPETEETSPRPSLSPEATTAFFQDALLSLRVNLLGSGNTIESVIKSEALLAEVAIDRTPEPIAQELALWAGVTRLARQLLESQPLEEDGEDSRGAELLGSDAAQTPPDLSEQYGDGFLTSHDGDFLGLLGRLSLVPPGKE